MMGNKKMQEARPGLEVDDKDGDIYLARRTISLATILEVYDHV